MNDEIEQLVNKTGLALPLAAKIMKAIVESEASDLEITIALDMVGPLRHAISGTKT